MNVGIAVKTLQWSGEAITCAEFACQMERIVSILLEMRARMI